MNTPNKQDELDEIKLQLAKFIIMNFSISTIREKGISNLNRWKSQDVWCSAHDEWRALLDTGSDEDIITNLNWNADSCSVPCYFHLSKQLSINHSQSIITITKTQSIITILKNYSNTRPIS
jgi:hypothetical protein